MNLIIKTKFENPISIKIEENDYFILEDKKYIIKDKANQNMLNIYFDMLLEVRNV